MIERMMKSRALVASLKRQYWGMYSADPNVVGMSFGRRIAGGTPTDQPAMVIYVVRKVPLRVLPISRTLPSRLTIGGDSVEIDVVETGPFYPLSFTTRERPAPSGISIGHPAITAGTLGCLVSDRSDGSLCILSNNHVLANQNAAFAGDEIIQPGTYDGGRLPGDRIGTLKRFITINSTGNLVDCAVAEVDNKADVLNEMMNNLASVPTPSHPAVGLLFAGSCNRTIMNPIGEVLRQLDIEFLQGPGATIAADLDMNVEKVGRTTEYTASTITEVDVTVSINYDFGSATFEQQIATAWMSDGGDSGSVVCRGGAGGREDRCGGCASTRTAESIMAADLSREAKAAQRFRDSYLRQTLIGGYLVNLFERNESRLLERLKDVHIRGDDRKYLRRIIAKYHSDAMTAALNPEQSKVRLTKQHLRDAEFAMRRAKRYLEDGESDVIERLLNLSRVAIGKNVIEIMALLNNERLFGEVREIVDKLEWLEK